MTKLSPTLPTPYTTQKIALDKISPNPANPRKHFDEGKLKELADTIAAKGILQAPGVRPLRAGGGVAMPGKFVLIWGERRTRAAKLAGLTEVECRVYDVDDAKAAELALIENDQRDDLTPLERAAGYQELVKKHGLSADQIADQVGRSRAWVYETMRLVDLSADAKKALADEDSPFTATHAAVIAGLPKEFHERALEAAVEGADYDGAMSSRDFKEWCESEFMLDLSKAKFDTTDATLVPKAGACTTCSKRTGFGQMDLLAEKGKKNLDLCKDKPCFGSKGDAQLARLAKTGTKVLSAEEAEEVFPDETADFISHRSDYVRADQKEDGSKKTFGDLVDATKHVMARVPGSGEIVELVPRSALPKPEKGPTSSPARARDPEDVKREKEHKARGLIQVALVDEMSRAKDVREGTDVFLRAISQGMSCSVQSEPSKQLCKRFGLDPQPGDDFREMFQDHLAKLSGVELRRAVLQLSYADSVPDFMWGGELDSTLLAGAKLLHVDAKKIEANVRAEIKEEGSAKTASKKAGEELAAKIAKVKKSKLTPHQQAALIDKMKGAVASKAKPVVEKVPTKVLAAAAKAKTAKKPAKAKAKKKAAKR